MLCRVRSARIDRISPFRRNMWDQQLRAVVPLIADRPAGRARAVALLPLTGAAAPRDRRPRVRPTTTASPCSTITGIRSCSWRIVALAAVVRIANVWVPAFLTALGGEAADVLQLLLDLERAWFAARRKVAGRRRNSRAAAAIDLLAAAPLLSATTLAAGLGMAVNNAAALLDGFQADGVAVEVTHRSKRRLFGLAALAPLRDEVAPPRRPMPGRGPGRPPNLPTETEAAPPPLPPMPLSPVERRAFDYTELEAAMAFAEERMRVARRNLMPHSGTGSPSTSEAGP